MGKTQSLRHLWQWLSHAQGPGSGYPGLELPDADLLEHRQGHCAFVNMLQSPDTFGSHGPNRISRHVAQVAPEKAGLFSSLELLLLLFGEGEMLDN